MNLTATIAACWPLLNATSETDAVFWTAAELWQFADEEAKRLARGGTVFVETASQSTVIGGGSYSLPPRHMATIEAVAGTQALRAGSVEELAARDRDWATRTGAQPSHYAQDSNGLDLITLYPAPLSVMALAILHVQHPSEVAVGSPSVTAPEVLRDEFFFATLAGARGKETPGAMPDVAKWCGGVAALYREVVSGLWR